MAGHPREPARSGGCANRDHRQGPCGFFSRTTIFAPVKQEHARQGNALFQNVEALLFSAEFGMRNAKKCKRVDDPFLYHSEIRICEGLVSILKNCVAL
jgi:hypothetical protein